MRLLSVRPVGPRRMLLLLLLLLPLPLALPLLRWVYPLLCLHAHMLCFCTRLGPGQWMQCPKTGKVEGAVMGRAQHEAPSVEWWIRAQVVCLTLWT